MTDIVRVVGCARVRRRASAACGLIAVAAAVAATAGPASASTHEYCNWDGSYNALAGGSVCFQSGDNFLTNNHAYLPYLPLSPLIYCAANKDGADYGGWSAGGNPSCDHAYAGANLLKAKETVSASATTHGVITY